MRVSIIITNYNYGRFLGRAIQSSLAQAALAPDDWEVVVVDDASTDTSRAVIESYAGDIRVVYHDEQRGLPAAINTGIRAAHGVYVMRLDADDWLDRHAAFVLGYFLDSNKEIGFVWPDYSIYDAHERVVGRISEPQGAGVMFRKQALVDIGLYDEDMRVHEDKDILLRCIERYPGYHLKLPLYHYFRHGASMTDQQDLMERYGTRLLEKHGPDALDRLQVNPGFLTSEERSGR